MNNTKHDSQIGALVILLILISGWIGYQCRKAQEPAPAAHPEGAEAHWSYIEHRGGVETKWEDETEFVHDIRHHEDVKSFPTRFRSEADISIPDLSQ